MSTSRETARDALVILLRAALVGTGLPVKTVSGSRQDTFKGITPLVSVLSGGSRRDPLSFQGDKGTFYLEVQVWVRQATTGWTNAEAEDALDTIERLIAETYESNRGTATWEIVEYEERTAVVELMAEGIAYYMERIPTVVKLARS